MKLRFVVGMVRPGVSARPPATQCNCPAKACVPKPHFGNERKLAAAIAGTSSNSNAVTTLGVVVSDPPTQAEMQAVVNKLDELILALRR